MKKSRLRGTLNFSTDADRSTDTKRIPKTTFFDKKKNEKKEEKNHTTSQKKKYIYYAISPKLYWCYYPHRSRDSVSPVCGIFCSLSELSVFQVEEWIERVDFDGDGQISYEEFKYSISGGHAFDIQFFQWFMIISTCHDFLFMEIKPEIAVCCIKSTRHRVYINIIGSLDLCKKMKRRKTT